MFIDVAMSQKDQRSETFQVLTQDDSYKKIQDDSSTIPCPCHAPNNKILLSVPVYHISYIVDRSTLSREGKGDSSLDGLVEMLHYFGKDLVDRSLRLDLQSIRVRYRNQSISTVPWPVFPSSHSERQRAPLPR